MCAGAHSFAFFAKGGTAAIASKLRLIGSNGTMKEGSKEGRIPSGTGPWNPALDKEGHGLGYPATRQPSVEHHRRDMQTFAS